MSRYHPLGYCALVRYLSAAIRRRLIFGLKARRELRRLFRVGQTQFLTCHM